MGIKRASIPCPGPQCRVGSLQGVCEKCCCILMLLSSPRDTMQHCCAAAPPLCNTDFLVPFRVLSQLDLNVNLLHEVMARIILSFDVLTLSARRPPCHPCSTIEVPPAFGEATDHAVQAAPASASLQIKLSCYRWENNITFPLEDLYTFAAAKRALSSPFLAIEVKACCEVDATLDHRRSLNLPLFEFCTSELSPAAIYHACAKFAACMPSPSPVLQPEFVLHPHARRLRHLNSPSQFSGLLKPRSTALSPSQR